VWEAWRKAYGSKQECVAFGGITCFPLADFACRLSVVPNDDEVLAYLRALPRLLGSNERSGVSHVSTLTVYVKSLYPQYDVLSMGAFPSRELQLDIDAAISLLVRDGQLRTHGSGDQAFISNDMLLLLIREDLWSSVNTGTSWNNHWDAVVQYLGPLVLQAAVRCRASDIVLSDSWVSEEKDGKTGIFLTWNDVQLRWDESEQRFHLLVHFACERGKRSVRTCYHVMETDYFAGPRIVKSRNPERLAKYLILSIWPFAQ